MDTLKRHQSSLSFNYHLGCAYVGDDKRYTGWRPDSKYVVGSLVDEKGLYGYCGVFCHGGPSISSRTVQQLCAKEPDSFVFVIGFKSEVDGGLYRTAREIVETYVEKDKDIEAFYVGNPMIRERRGVLEERMQDVKNLHVENAKIQELYDSKIKRLEKFLEDEFEELGCNTDECNVGPPKLKVIPDDWYEYEETRDLTRLTIIVCGRRESTFYNDLLTNKLI